MSVRVQFREDEAIVGFVTALGLNPNEVARDAFRAEARRLRARQKRLKVAAVPRKSVKGGYAALVREDRDAR